MMTEHAVFKEVRPILESELTLKTAKQARWSSGRQSQTNSKAGSRVQSINASRDPSPKN